MIIVQCYKCGKQGELPEDTNLEEYITVKAWGFILTRMETKEKVWVCESCYENAD